MTEGEMNLLDKRNNVREKESPSARKEIIRREITRAMHRFIEHLPHSYVASEAARHDVQRERRVDFKDRLTESTYHPSQNLPREFYKYLAVALKDLRDRHKNDAGNITVEDIERESEAAATWIYNKSEDKLGNLMDAAIKSNASLDESEITRIQQTLVNRLGAYLGDSQRKYGWSPHEHFKELMAAIPQSTLRENLQKIVDEIRVEPHPDRLDESWETVLEAKTLLLDNVVSEHHVWIDFDGAKRAEGHIYTKYAALLHEDIQRNRRQLPEDERAQIDKTYATFLENTSLNHAITSQLRDPSKIDVPVYALLEKTLTILKAQRYEQLDQLIRGLNEIKQANLSK